MNILIAKPMPPRISAPPTTRPIADWVPSENELAIWTPTSDIGAEPTSIQSASDACTLPSRRWCTAPNDLKIAPCRMSVPTAAFGSKPKIRISIGVIRLPPPMPVIPTRIPTAAPASANCQVRSAFPGSGTRRTGGRAARSASLYIRQPVQKPVTAASSASAATSSPSTAPSVGSAGGVGDRRSREHDESHDVGGARRA